ncbi:MAG: Gldg family protein [Candidatus Eisenbacteria bacterium]
MKSRSTLGANSILMVAIALAILVVANLALRDRFFRLDMTENRQYTLSGSTKDILRGLDDVVNVKVYFSKDLPTYLVTLNQDVNDLLGEYQAYGEGNLLVEWEDPADDPETEQRCRVLGIPQVQLQIFEKDKAQVTNAYLGIAVLYEDRSEVIPVVQNVGNMEYDLTAAILKVFRKEEKTVGVLKGGPGSPSLDQGLANVKQLLERQYRVAEVDIAGGRKVPSEVRTLVVVGPVNLSDRDCFEIDQFVMGGGALLVFHDAITIPEGSIRANPKFSGMREMLKSWGVDVGENLALDARSHSNAAFNQGFITFSMPYPYWVKVAPENVNEANPMVNQLSGIVLPWTSTVAAADTLPESVTVDTLMTTTEFGWAKAGSYDLNPQQRFPDAPREPAVKLPLAVAAGGTFPSFFGGKEIPPARGMEEAAGIAPPSDDGRGIVPMSPETQVVVFGSANMVMDDMIGQFPNNVVLLQNAVDWLTLGDELIAIRSRSAVDRPIREVSERWKSIAKFLVTFGVPLLVVLFGVVRYIRLRNSREEARLAESGGGA